MIRERQRLAEARETGLTVDELRGRSFLRIVEGRTRRPAG